MSVPPLIWRGSILMCPAAVENYSRIKCLFLKKRVYKRLMCTKKFHLASVPLECIICHFICHKKCLGGACVCKSWFRGEIYNGSEQSRVKMERVCKRPSGTWLHIEQHDSLIRKCDHQKGHHWSLTIFYFLEQLLIHVLFLKSCLHRALYASYFRNSN